MHKQKPHSVKATIHQATFRQFIAYNHCRQRIAVSNPQTTRCIQYLYLDLKNKIVVKTLLFALALFYWLRHYRVI